MKAHSLAQSLTLSRTHSFYNSLCNHSFAHSINQFTRSITHSFTHSFFHSPPLSLFHFSGHSVAHTRWCTDIQIHSYRDTERHKYTPTQVRKYINTLFHRSTESHIHGYTDIQSHRFSPTHKRRYTDTQIHIYRTASYVCWRRDEAGAHWRPQTNSLHTLVGAILLHRNLHFFESACNCAFTLSAPWQ